MNLFPKIEQNPSDPNPEKENGQMTIFYAGQVVVFNDIPADKAKEIMTLATNYSAAAAPPQKPTLSRRAAQPAPLDSGKPSSHPPKPN